MRYRIAIVVEVEAADTDEAESIADRICNESTVDMVWSDTWCSPQDANLWSSGLGPIS